MNQEASSKSNLRDCLEQFVQECLDKGIHFKDAMQQMEMEFVMAVLAKTGYNISKAAGVIGVNRNTLSKKIHSFQSSERFQDHQKLHSAR